MCLRVPKDDPIVFVDRRHPRRVQVESYRRTSRPVSRVSETIITHHRRSSRHHSTSTVTLPPPSPKPSTPVQVVVPVAAPPTPAPSPPAPVPISTTPIAIPATPAFVPATPAPIRTSPAISRSPRTPPQAPTPPESRIELIQVEEQYDAERTSPSASASRTSRRKSRRGSASSFHREREHGSSREELYIQRERIIERGTPSPSRTPPQEGGYRYVEGVGKGRDIDHNRVIGGYGHVREGEVEALARKRGSVTYVGESPRSSGRFSERERVVVDEGQRRREFYRRG